VTAVARVQPAFWCFCRCLSLGPVLVLTKVRYFNVPDRRTLSGGLLLASNHQSFLDPLLVGLALPVPIRYVARRELFGVPGFGRLISALGAIPVARGQIDSRALRAVLSVLRRGEPVLVFPEATRTRDGELGRFKRGAASMALRCGVPVLPVAIEGAFACWPRTRLLPRPARVAVVYGEPVRPEGQDADKMTRRIRDEVETLRKRARRFLRRGIE